jgi:hypothetical protein
VAKYKTQWVALAAALGGLLVGGVVGIAAKSSSTKTTTLVRTEVQKQTTVEIKTVTKTKTVAAPTSTPTASIDCPGRVHSGGAGIGSVTVQGTTCETATAVLLAQDHLGWTCRDLHTPGPNGFPGICERNGQTIRYVAGD